MNYQKILVRLLRQTKGQLEDTWKTQCAVLTAQVGHFAKCVQYARVYPQDEKAHKTDAARAIGDLMIQCQITCELLGLDCRIVTSDALIAFRDRMKEISKMRADTRT